MVSEELKAMIAAELSAAENKIECVNELRAHIHSLSPMKEEPVDFVRWIPIERIQANDYNPNSVGSREMGLLYTSIKQDGYTQPIVVIEDKDARKHIIIDGSHRYFTGKQMQDIRKK